MADNIKNRSTKDGCEYWGHVEDVAQEVRNWPEYEKVKNMAMSRNTDSPRSRAHWKFVEQISRLVDSWPEWKKGKNMAIENTCTCEVSAGPSCPIHGKYAARRMPEWKLSRPTATTPDSPKPLSEEEIAGIEANRVFGVLTKNEERLLATVRELQEKLKKRDEQVDTLKDFLR